MTADQTTGVAETSKHSGMLTLLPIIRISLGDGTWKLTWVFLPTAYRPLLGTDKGICHENDAAAGKIKYTDAEGNLTLVEMKLRGYQKLLIWEVTWCMGTAAPDNQDIRVKGSIRNWQDIFATEALDPQVIYEGFKLPRFCWKDSQYTNKLIAENAELFKSWGITHSRWPLNL